ncbi:MAG: hypothetical protein K1Y02_18535 [Candidatus Hydrogenedentes bacterium]|nr:hypothetical protein [Candidatus Hydrogenedentota bacterium]
MTGNATTPPSRFTRRFWIACAIVIGLVLFERPLTRGHDVEKQLRGGRDMHLIWAGQLGEYAHNHAGNLPPLDAKPKSLMFDRTGVRPAYRLAPWGAWPWHVAGVTPVMLDDRNAQPVYLLKDFFESDRYFYLGYAVSNDTEGRAFLRAYAAQMASGAGFDKDLPVEKGQGTFGTDTLYRLNMRLCQNLLAQGVHLQPGQTESSIPIFFDRPGLYPQPGGWVCYLDGSYRFVPYPGPFPMTPEFIAGLNEIVRTETPAK